jgi:hypothetical protein
MENSMKRNYASAIEKELEDMPFMFKVRKDEDETRFEVWMPSDRLQVLRVILIIDEDGDVKLRCYLASGVEARILPALREKINELNSRYRFVCLSVDEDDDVCASYDFILFGDEESAVRQAVTTLVIFADITDKCAPVLLPLTWNSDDENGESVNVNTKLFQSEGGDL